MIRFMTKKRSNIGKKIPYTAEKGIISNEFEVLYTFFFPDTIWTISVLFDPISNKGNLKSVVWTEDLANLEFDFTTFNTRVSNVWMNCRNSYISWGNILSDQEFNTTQVFNYFRLDAPFWGKKRTAMLNSQSVSTLEYRTSQERLDTSNGTWFDSREPDTITYFRDLPKMKYFDPILRYHLGFQ